MTVCRHGRRNNLVTLKAAEFLFDCVCVFQMWVKLLCVLSYQIMPSSMFLKTLQQFDRLFTLPCVATLRHQFIPYMTYAL